MDVTSQLNLNALSQYPVDSGGSCDIYRGQLYSGTKVALKLMRVFQPTTKKNEYYPHENMRRILGIWRKCEHPNVVHLIGDAAFRGGIAAVYEWLDYGSVTEYLKHHPTAERWELSAQISKGVAYLHTNGIVHNSLKGTNILVSANGTPYIRLSLLTSTNLAHDKAGDIVPSLSARWAAPELLLAESGGTFASDVYAIGMTILETITMAVPYADHKETQVVRKIMNRGLPSRPRDHVPHTPAGDALWALLCSCWSFEPISRPSAVRVYETIRSICTGSGEIGPELPSPASHSLALSTSTVPLRLVVTEDTRIEDLVTYFGGRGLKDYSDALKSTNIATATPFADTALANVYKIDLPDRKPVAVKCVKHVTSYKKLKRAARELSCWFSHKHENILPVLGFSILRGDLAMVSPWMSNGCVTEYVTSNPNCDRIRLCTELSCAIVYLHGCNLVHGDIKGANVLICDAGTVKVTDFGVSIMEHKEVEFSATSTSRGTQRWQSPEILLGDSDSTKEGDVYALGMTFIEILTGQRPYGLMPWAGQAMINIINGQLRPSRPITLSVDNSGNKLWELMNRCWAGSPSERPNSGDVYKVLKGIQTHSRFFIALDGGNSSSAYT